MFVYASVCMCVRERERERAVNWFSNNVSLARGSAQKIVFALTEGVHVLTDLTCALQLTNFSHCSLMIGD